MNLDSKIELTNAMSDLHSLIAGEFEYVDADKILYCGYEHDSYKGVSPLGIAATIQPFYVFNANIDIKPYIGIDNIDISIFGNYNFNIEMNLSAYQKTKITSVMFNTFPEHHYFMDIEHKNALEISVSIERS